MPGSSEGKQADSAKLVMVIPVALKAAKKIVERLLPVGDTRITDDVLTPIFARHQGNMREVLFALYDLYEKYRC